MDVCSALNELRAINNRIERHRDDVIRLRAQMERCTSALTGMPRGGASGGFAEIQARIDELERQLREDGKRTIEIIEEVDKSPEMARLNPSEDKAIRLLYYYGLSRNQTCRQMQYDRTWVWRLEQSALKKLSAK